MKNTYLFSGIFQTDTPLSEKQVSSIRNSICAQVEDPVDGDGKGMDVNVDLESLTIIPFNDKVKIVINSELLEED